MLDGVSGFDNDGSTYPPYNIERLGDNQYRITMAVAGFGEPEINIEVKEQTLSVKGEKKAAEKEAAVPASRHRHAHLRAPLPASPTMSR